MHDAKQQEDEHDELKQALEQLMFEELHRQKIEAERRNEEIKKQTGERRNGASKMRGWRKSF